MQSSGPVDRRNFARVPGCGDGASPVSQREIFLNNRCVKYSSSGRENYFLKEYFPTMILTHLVDGK